MRSTILYLVFLGFVFSLQPLKASAAIIIPPAASKIIPPGDIYKKIGSLKLKEFQKLAGRKLTIREKIGFLILKHKINHPRKTDTSKGQTALVFGIVALGLFVLGLFVPYVIIASLISSIVAIVSGSVALRNNRNDKKAFAGKLLGWITFGLIALLLVLAIIWLSSWGF
jgi:FtsH-binding integral membrane protein